MKLKIKLKIIMYDVTFVISFRNMARSEKKIVSRLSHTMALRFEPSADVLHWLRTLSSARLLLWIVIGEVMGTAQVRSWN